ncbi:MAG TPA: class I SAM-dependent methyltransferase [Candidatus Binatia bacterium]|nr:class I SAM-dependent methyltransferase [Candidatus Binatia bacterium]
MNAVIERIRASGYVEDAEGKTYPAKASAVSFEAGALLYDFIRAAKPARTLEIGMAYGISTLFICQAHRDNGSGTHTAIDPFEETVFKSIGLLNLERAKLRDLVQFHPAPSDEVLPQLCTRNERYEFAFIDGNHRFDYVLVDFFYVDKLLEVGGHVAFDDIWMSGVRKAASFVTTNKPYRLVRAPATARTPTSTRMLRLGRRILQNPFGRDWALKLVPQNVAIFEKTAKDSRVWDFHRTF